ncbi:MAG: glycosyl hydrolase, partial [Flavobacterium sp.]|nr:glycosyl hydrolase [Flavobacterium sp.]
IMVYRAKRASRIDTNDPSQIIDKIALNANNDLILVHIPNNHENDHASFAFTYVDFYGNESTPTIVN